MLLPVLPLALLLAGADASAVETRALERINDYRKIAELPPVTVDPALSKACQAHADYMLKNYDVAFNGKLNVHDEDSKLPGFSEAGRKAAKSSVISQGFGRGDGLAGIDVWMASFYHRVPLLDPGLAKIGVGFARQGQAGGCCLVVDKANGKVRPKQGKVVCYPVEDQKDVPRLFCLGFPENPNPLPNNGDSKKAGQPITVTFFVDKPAVTAATGTLKDADGKEVPVWLSWAEKPAVRGFGGNSICLIPQAPLLKNTTYTVSVACKTAGKEWKNSWKFMTGEK